MAALVAPVASQRGVPAFLLPWNTTREPCPSLRGFPWSGRLTSLRNGWALAPAPARSAGHRRGSPPREQTCSTRAESPRVYSGANEMRHVPSARRNLRNRNTLPSPRPDVSPPAPCRTSFSFPDFPVDISPRPGQVVVPKAWGCSSVGRALEWHSRGRQFNSVQLHHARSRVPQ